MPATSPFRDYPMFGYQLLYADPAWAFDNWSEKGEDRNANQHYPTMTVEEIAALPVGELASDNCALAMWVTDPLLDRAIYVMKHWGFRFTTVLFTWTKEKPSGAEHIGTGYYTRANPEMCLLGMMGTMPVLDRGVRQWRHAPVREHSRKPDEFADDLVRLFGNVPRIELFARTKRSGWDSWGSEVGKFSIQPEADHPIGDPLELGSSGIPLQVVAAPTDDRDVCHDIANRRPEAIDAR